MERSELKVGAVYRAKRPSLNFFGKVHNDRRVIWMDSLGIQLQYDSDTVPRGRHYPRIDVEKFLKWAARELTPQEYIDDGYRDAPEKAA